MYEVKVRMSLQAPQTSSIRPRGNFCIWSEPTALAVHDMAHDSALQILFRHKFRAVNLDDTTWKSKGIFIALYSSHSW
jgi:hypothetical protein